MKKSNYLLAIALGASTLTYAQVGIGTSLPSNALDIETTGPAIDINDTGGGDPEINLQISGTTTFSVGIDNSDSDKLKIGTTAPDASTSITIDGSQNVGIGNTSPTAKLDVDGSAIFNESGAAVDFRIEGDTEANLLFVDASADKVGIGTSSPDVSLDVNGSIRAVDMAIESHSSIGIQGLHFQWNRDLNGIGYILNQKGTGTGGIIFGKSTTGNVITEQMLLSDEGYLGIGTTSPTATLDVDGSAIFNESGAAVDFRVEGDTEANLLFVDASTNRVAIGTSSPNVTLDVRGGTTVRGNDAIISQGLHLQWNKSGGLGRAYILNQRGLGTGGIVFGKSTTGDVITEQMFLSDGGYLGIGTTSPGYILTVNGQPGANGYTAFTNYSDRRLKTNIDSLENGALDKILQLNPVSFQYNDKYLQLYPGSNLDKVHKGFIAQEIQKVFPEMVSKMKESPDSVQYLDLDISHLQVYLVKALQEQQAIIEAQKKEIETQKAELDTQKVQLDSKTSDNAEEIEALKAQVQQLLQLIQQQESASVK